jgi:hypothetical protein
MNCICVGILFVFNTLITKFLSYYVHKIPSDFIGICHYKNVFNMVLRILIGFILIYV